MGRVDAINRGLDQVNPLASVEIPSLQGRVSDEEWKVRVDLAAAYRMVEAIAAPRAGRFLFGDTPTVADICLVPQLYNARRFNVPLDDFPTLLRADAEATALDAFAAAHPDRVAPTA